MKYILFVLTILFCFNVKAVEEPEGKFVLTCKGTSLNRSTLKEVPVVLVTEGEGEIDSFFPSGNIRLNYGEEVLSLAGPNESSGYQAIELQDQLGGFFIVSYHDWKTELLTLAGDKLVPKTFDNHLEILAKPKSIKIEGSNFSSHKVMFDGLVSYSLSYQKTKEEAVTRSTSKRNYDELKCVLEVTEK